MKFGNKAFDIPTRFLDCKSVLINMDTDEFTLVKKVILESMASDLGVNVLL